MRIKNAPYPLYEMPRIVTFRDFVDYCERKYSEYTAFAFKNGKQLVEKSYTDFREDVRKAASMLVAKGFHQDRIAILGENSYGWIIAYFAGVVSGNIVVPIDKQLPIDQVEYILKETDAKMLFVSPSYNDYSESVREKIPQIEIFTLQNDVSKWKLDKAENDDAILNSVSVYPDDIAAIIYTSGTTGMAKGVILTQRNICSNCIGGLQNLRAASTTDTTILTLPLHHTYSLVGSVMTFMGEGLRIYINRSIRDLQTDIKEQHPTTMAMVPLMVETFYKRIWNTAEEKQKEKKLKTAIKVSNALLRIGIDVRRSLFKDVLEAFGIELNLIIVGGAPLDERYIKGFRSFGIQIIQGYGITECSPMVSVTRNHYYKDASVGLKLPNVDIKIDKFENSQEGEICVKGECVFKGYFNNPELTAESFDEDGWFKTGDVGYVDEDNFVYITGRKKNMILLSNGKNVYPEELEFEWMKNPAVKEVLVYEKDDAIAVEIFPDDEYFKANPADQDAFFAEVLADFNHRQPPHKNISQVILRDTPFPKTTSMKIKRNYNN